MKKYFNFFITNILLIIILPILRTLNKSFYESKILPLLIKQACSSNPISHQRKKTIPHAKGVVLEIGFGTGLNLEFYDINKLEKLIALEPSDALIASSIKSLQNFNIPFEILNSVAEKIPLDDQSVDTVVSTYTLCSVDHIDNVLSEIKRVLKPDGKFIFSEHGISPDKLTSFIQNNINFFYPKVSGGCHVNRDIKTELIRHSFILLECNTMYIPSTQKFLGFNYWGTASLERNS